MKRIEDNNFWFAAIFFAMLLIIGVPGDYNLYRYIVYGETTASYDGSGSEYDSLVSDYTINFPFKTQFVDVNGLVRRLFGQREMNEVVKLNNGHLSAVANVQSDRAIAGNVQAVADFNAYCKENGILMLYVQPPYKISKWDDQLPAGVTDGHNETLDKTLSGLEENGVKIMDLRQEMYDDGLDQYDYFFTTDHHWTMEAGFYAFCKITAWVSEETGTKVEEKLLDIDNYQIDTYENWFLGYRGQRTGSLFAGTDDFDLIYPKFETNIHSTLDGSTRSFQEAVIDYSWFQESNYNGTGLYDYAYVDINPLYSEDAQTDLSVLVLGDSFRCAVNPFMLLAYTDYNAVQLENLSTSLLEEYNPDVVILLPYSYPYTAGGFVFLDDAAM